MNVTREGEGQHTWKSPHRNVSSFFTPPKLRMRARKDLEQHKRERNERGDGESRNAAHRTGIEIRAMASVSWRALGVSFR